MATLMEQVTKEVEDQFGEFVKTSRAKIKQGFDIKISERDLTGLYVDDWQALIRMTLDTHRELKLERFNADPRIFWARSGMPDLDVFLKDFVPPQCRIAVILARLCYAVEQHGWVSWDINVSASLELSELQLILTGIPGPNVARLRDMLGEVIDLTKPKDKHSDIEGRRLPSSERDPGYAPSGIYLDYKYRVIGYTPGGEEILEEYTEERFEMTHWQRELQRLVELTDEFVSMTSLYSEIGAYFMMQSNPMV